MSRSKTPMFILAGNGSCLNRGCEAILRGTIAILQREFGPCRFVSTPYVREGVFDSKIVRHPRLKHRPPAAMPRFSPAWFRRQISVRILHRSNFVFDRYLGKAKAVLALGGDNFSLDYNTGLPRRQFAAAEVALRSGRPMIIWGASVGPFSKNPEYEKVAVALLKRISLITVRETVSRDYLASQGVVDNVRVVADPAFVMEPIKPRLEPDLSQVLDGPCIGLNLSPLLGVYLDDPREWPERAKRCLQAIDQSVDLPVVLVPHVMCSTRNDHTFLSGLRAQLSRTRNPVYLVGSHYNAPQIKWIISRLSLFVGARTHSTVASLSSCVPTISIGYSVKAKGINQDIFGHLDWLIEVNDLEPARLAEAVVRLVSEAESLKTQLQEKMPAYQARAWLGGKYVREVLEGAS